MGEGEGACLLALYAEKDVQVRRINVALMSACLAFPLFRVERLPDFNQRFQEALTGKPDKDLELPGAVFNSVQILPVMLRWRVSELPDGDTRPQG
ncbi:MAG: hypothetical protein ABW101_17420 [Candidatus Thiodiazotropha sp.]